MLLGAERVWDRGGDWRSKLSDYSFLHVSGIRIFTGNADPIKFETSGTNRVTVRGDGTGTDFDGNIKLTTAGNKLYIKEGTNASMGVATLVAGTVTVSTTAATSSSRIFLTTQTLGTVTVPKAMAAMGPQNTSSTIESNTDSGNSNFIIIARSFTTTAASTVSKLGLYVGTAAGNVRLGLWDNNAGAPNNLKVETAGTAVSATG